MPSLVPGQIFATQKRNGTKRRKLGLVHTARVLVRMLIPFPRIWGIRNLLYIPATLYRILVRFVKNGRAREWSLSSFVLLYTLALGLENAIALTGRPQS